MRPQDRGVNAGGESHHDARLQGVVRLEPGVADLGFLSIHPVVVGSEEGTIGVVELEGRVGEGGKAEVG